MDHFVLCELFSNILLSSSVESKEFSVLCRLKIILLAVKKEKGHGKCGKDEADEGGQNCGKESRSEVFSNITCVRWKFLCCPRWIDPHRKKKTCCRSDYWKNILRDG